MTHAKLWTPSRSGRWLSTGLLTALLAGCGGGASGDGSGTLRLAMTDAPACGYDHVYVTVTRIRVHQSASATGAPNEAGWAELIIPPQRIDLLSLTNGVLQELGSLPLPAGSYQQIRLVLSDAAMANALVTSGSNTEIALTTPSAQQSGYKLQARFDVAAGQVVDMVLDFDACKSIVQAGNSGRYNLKPVVSVIPRVSTAIEGYVNPAIAASVVVSTRDPNNQLRATVPNATTGKFTLAYLPESTSYTVVIAGQDVTTAAITGVPVSLATSVTALNTAATAINLPPSASGTVGGLVRDSANTLLTGATVSARQTLGNGQSVDIAFAGVDPVTALYGLTLPVAAPLRAPYVASGPLVFTADLAAAGQYGIFGAAPGYTGQSTAPALALTGGAVVTKDVVLTP